MNMREKIARAIYDKATRFDGDEIAVHLGNSMMIDGSAVDAEDLKRIVLQVCEDAADAVLDAVMEPTEGMLATCWPLHHPWGERAPPPADRPEMFRGVVAAAKQDWQAMIRAAKEGK